MIPDVQLIATWTAGGVLAGAVFAAQARRLLTTSTPVGPPTAQLTGTVVTGVLFGILACRFGPHLDLLPYSYLAAVGVAAGTVDLIEQRLPGDLVLPAYVVLGTLFATSAVLHSDVQSLLRALAGAAILATFYLVLALASRGGLGAGDVKFGGLLGLALGWLSWSAIVAATLLAWFAAALALAFLRGARLRPIHTSIPMGPFLLLGALATVAMTPS